MSDRKSEIISAIRDLLREVKVCPRHHWFLDGKVMRPAHEDVLYKLADLIEVDGRLMWAPGGFETCFRMFRIEDEQRAKSDVRVLVIPLREPTA